MRITIVVGLLLVFRCAALGKGIDRRVERGSELEKELGYTLSGQDKHGEWRSQGMDKLFPIEGLAAEYMLKFHATAADKLKDLSGVILTVKRADGIVVLAPLAIRSKCNKENEVGVQFLLKKDMIDDAVSALRCEARSEAGRSYVIRPRDYAPGNESAHESPTPAILIPGPYHVIRLATVTDIGEQIATLDFKVFKSVEALKGQIATLPGGTEVYFQRWAEPSGVGERTSLFRPRTSSRNSVLSIALRNAHRC